MPVSFLEGAVAMGFMASALMFLGFWRRSRASLFLAFAGAFALLALNQLLLAVTATYLEERSWLYIIRLAAFLLIIFAIWCHNRAEDRTE
ncbi:MAG: hypothetical protein EOP17_00305 [Rhizobiaceae bacterium]|nr:MAG: hypothetical protein EOP17_00305 [Rhizobiaceae bacterium]